MSAWLNRPGGALAIAAACTLVVHAGQDPSSPQAPVFRGGNETVAVYATALDRGGQMVLNLQREDFEVLDDGRPQPLTVFVKGLQPITAALLIDTSASMTLSLELALQAAEQFVIRMLPGDRVRVGSFSDRVDLSPEFTSDRDRLLVSLREGLHVGNSTKMWDAIDQTMTSLAPLAGRRIVVLLTDGLDTSSRVFPTAVSQRLRVDDLMVYIVQLRSSRLGNLAEIPLAPSAGSVFGSPPMQPGRAVDAMIQKLADQTGGGHFILDRNDDVNATFTAVMQELHYQYTLGFTPERADGRLHTLEVKVRKPGVTVRARRNYLAAPIGSREQPR